MSERLVVEALNDWLSGVFDPSHIDQTVDAMVDAAQPDDHDIAAYETACFTLWRPRSSWLMKHRPSTAGRDNAMQRLRVVRHVSSNQRSSRLWCDAANTEFRRVRGLHR